MDNNNGLAAKAELWRRGILSWKLCESQKVLYELFYKSDFKTQVWLLSRRFGKSRTLCILAIETCLRKPNSVVKFVSPTKKQTDDNIRPLMKQLTDDCPDAIKPEFKKNQYIYYFPNGSEIQLAGSESGHAEKLRGANCLAENTLIMTPDGPRAIQDLRIGDLVYGKNLDGSITTTPVLAVYDNGVQTVTKYTYHGQTMFESTDDHLFQTISSSSYSRKKLGNKKILKAKDIKEGTKIFRHHIDIPCGQINEPDAYLIGAFIGDGCCTDTRGYQLNFSEKGSEVSSYIAKHLGCFFKDRGGNCITFKNNTEYKKHGTPITFNYYNEWIKGQNFLQKNFDYEVVDTWNRISCLKLLAGLIDTDGSVYAGKESLEISYASANKALIDNISKLFYKLYQVKPNLKTRSNDRVNTLYTLTIKNNIHSRRILKELTPYLNVSRKKWKDTYTSYISDYNLDTIFVKKEESREARVYDISVGNDSHLYLLANGVVTHNCDLAIIDEGGVCSDLNNLVKNILLPTTLMTKGKVLIAGTPPRESDHDFIKFVEEAEHRGSLVRRTIDENSLLTPQMREELIAELGGPTSESTLRELYCQLIKDPTTSVIPEFTPDLEKDIVKSDYIRPSHFDTYESMDLGFKDLTVVLFAYYDFKIAKVVIEDELVRSGTDLQLPKLIDDIKDKEFKLWINPITNEINKPCLRVSDINYIVTQEIYRASHGEIQFAPAKKDDKDSAINQLRVLLASKKIIINPRCKVLLQHLRNVKWKSANNRSEFARSPDDGHYDAVDAMAYLIRHINYSRNPYPSYHGINLQDLYVPTGSKFHQRHGNSTNNVEIFKQIFNKKNKD